MNKEIKVGLLIFTIIVSLITLYIGYKFYRIHSSTYPLTIIFPKKEGLEKNNAVTYLGVKIGQIKKIGTDINEVYVDVMIDKTNKIPVDSKYAIKRIGLFSEKEISISPGNNKEFYKANDTINYSDVDTTPSFDKMSDVTNTFVGVSNIMLQKEIIAKLDTVIELLKEKKLK
jgi:ABC-type transporter Mla subunit MlaD